MTQATAIAELLEHLSRRIQGAAYAHDLKPAQWSALRYYARADRTARTIRAFAGVHASSHSAASQIVTGLKRKRLLVSYTSKRDAREQVVELTAAGTKLLRHDPMKPITRALQRMTEREQCALLKSLRDLIDGAFHRHASAD